MDKPLGVIGTALLDIAEVIKKKYQVVYKHVIDINKTISKGLVDSKTGAAVLKNVKKPFKDLQAGDMNASLDQMMSESIDKPLFQQDNRDVSGSGQGMRLDSSESGNKAKALTDNSSMKKFGDNLRFDMDGYLMEAGDHYTTEQHEHLTQNIFTQGMQAVNEKKSFIDGLSFDEIKEKLNQEFDAKVAKPKREKLYVTVDEDILRSKQSDAPSLDSTFDFSISHDIDVEAKLASDYGLTRFRFADFEEILSKVPRDKEAQRDAPEPQEELMNQLGLGDVPFADFGYDQNFFEDKTDLDIKDQFIGDDLPNLALPDEKEEGPSAIVEKILKMVPKDLGKKKAPKLFFADIVKAFEKERDAADIFYDLMCAARTGDIHLLQAFPTDTDKATRLPVIEVASSH